MNILFISIIIALLSQGLAVVIPILILFATFVFLVAKKFVTVLSDEM